MQEGGVNRRSSGRRKADNVDTLVNFVKRLMRRISERGGENRTVDILNYRRGQVIDKAQSSFRSIIGEPQADVNWSEIPTKVGALELERMRLPLGGIPYGREAWKGIGTSTINLRTSPLDNTLVDYENAPVLFKRNILLMLRFNTRNR